MKAFPVVFSMTFCIYAAAAELSGSESGLNLETRRAEATGKSVETFRTMEGKIYREVVITKIDAGGVSFKHADGVARLRYDDLSPGQRKYFGIDREAAAEMYRREAKQRAVYEELVEKRTEERRIRAEKKAIQREQSRQLAMAAAAAETAKAAARSESVIPPYPTIKRVDTRVPRTRSYSFYGPFYGGYYGYSPYTSYRPSYRGGLRFGSYSYSTPSIIIRR